MSLPDFLTAGAVEAAPLLLGYKLVHHSPDGNVSGIIVETEAYNMLDAASHSFKGETVRTKPMFDRAGTIYVYFTYGMHYCMNIVTGSVGQGEAVLIRALQPVEGIAIMQQKREDKAIEQKGNPRKMFPLKENLRRAKPPTMKIVLLDTRESNTHLKMSRMEKLFLLKTTKIKI